MKTPPSLVLLLALCCLAQGSPGQLKLRPSLLQVGGWKPQLAPPLAVVRRGGRPSSSPPPFAFPLSRRTPVFCSLSHRCLSIRGGASVSDEQDDDESSSSSTDPALFDSLVSDEDDLYSRLKSSFLSTPPLTRLYLSASLAAGLFGLLFSGNDFPSLLDLDYRKALLGLQLWRPFTAFLNFGPLGLGFFLTAHFVWTYMSSVEVLHKDEPAEFMLLLAGGMAAMSAAYGLTGINPRLLGHNLSTYLLYIWSRLHEGQEVNLMGLFNLRAELLPWYFLLQTFLLEGELPVLDLLGIAFGHAYCYACKETGRVRAPQALKDWYREGTDQLAKWLRTEYSRLDADDNAGDGEGQEKDDAGQ